MKMTESLVALLTGENRGLGLQTLHDGATDDLFHITKSAVIEIAGRRLSGNSVELNLDCLYLKGGIYA